MRSLASATHNRVRLEIIRSSKASQLQFKAASLSSVQNLLPLARQEKILPSYSRMDTKPDLVLTSILVLLIFFPSSLSLEGVTLIILYFVFSLIYWW